MPLLSQAVLFTHFVMKDKARLSTREMVLFSALTALLFLSDLVLEIAMNVELVSMLIATYTLVFRKKALVPLYIYVFLDGLFGGFGTWWIPYLYIWTILWGVTMLLPKKMPRVAKCIIYPIVCCLHGLLFGVLYAPVQAIMFHLNFEQTLVWIASGFPYDVLHAAGNLVFGMFIVPFSELFEKLLRKQRFL